MTGAAASAARRDRIQQRPAVTPDLLAGLAGKLTTRDRWLLGMLAEHRVLTTTQITGLAFRGARRQAERRLAGLWAWRCVDRFRPHTPRGAGSAPFHWVLDDAGAAVLAAAHRITAREFGHHRATALGISHSQRLAHTVGTNTLLAALAAPTSRADGTGTGSSSAEGSASGRLVTWWGERRCAAAWGDLARPDAAGTWEAPGGATMGFAVEYDTGTEALPRVARKLADYADLAAAVGHILPVLFWLPSIAREAALHRQLDPTGLLVATATAEHAATAGGPTRQVWRPAAPAGPGHRGIRQGRVTLDQLTTDWATTDWAATTRGTMTGAAFGALPIATVDVGLGWPAPDPLPPPQHPVPSGADPHGADPSGADPGGANRSGVHNGADVETGGGAKTGSGSGSEDRGRGRAGRSWES
jgi:hypothetical protein